MDLIAMSNDKGNVIPGIKIENTELLDIFCTFGCLGEVIVQRLNLQVLWVQPPPSDDSKVRGIDWRPDERILAIGENVA